MFPLSRARTRSLDSHNVHLAPQLLSNLRLGTPPHRSWPSSLGSGCRTRHSPSRSRFRIRRHQLHQRLLHRPRGYVPPPKRRPRQPPPLCFGYKRYRRQTNGGMHNLGRSGCGKNEQPSFGRQLTGVGSPRHDQTGLCNSRKFSIGRRGILDHSSTCLNKLYLLFWPLFSSLLPHMRRKPPPPPQRNPTT